MKRSVNTNFIKSLATDYAASLQGSFVVDIITFAKSNWGLNIKLLPVQTFILKCFYGMKLDDEQKNIVVKDDVNDKIISVFSEVEFMRYLIENKRTNLTEYVPDNKFRRLILCAGRRASKSTLASVISNYEVYKLIKKVNPQEFYGFPPGHEIVITSVATSDEQAMALFDMIKNRGLNCSYIKDRIINCTQTYYNLQTDHDIETFGKRKKSSIWLVCGGSASNSLRGRNNIVVILDEAAFFADNSGRFSGKEVYKALTPSILSFTAADGSVVQGDGKIIVLSSPFSKTGIFWDVFNESFDRKDEDLMFKMYSAMLNPTVDSSFLKSEKRRNKVSFLCEYGGEFSDVIASWIEEEEKFDACINKEMVRNPHKGQPYVEYFMGIDLGLKNDGTAISIVHKEEDKIILDWADVYYSSSSDIWDFPDSIYKGCKEFSGYDIIPIQVVAEKIKDLCNWFPIKSGWFDQWNGPGLYEMLCNLNLHQFKMESVTDGLNMRMYQLVKMLYLDGLLTLFDHPVLIKELHSLQEEKRGKSIKVEALQVAGAHDDISDAYVRAVWACYQHTGGSVPHVAMSFNKDGIVNSRHQMTMNAHRRKKLINSGGVLTRSLAFKSRSLAFKYKKGALNGKFR